MVARDQAFKILANHMAFVLMHVVNAAHMEA